MQKYLFLIFIVAQLMSCKKSLKKDIDVSAIPVQITMQRFETDFYTASKKDLPKLKKKYPLLFPNKVADSVWVNKINNKDEQELFNETQKAFKNISDVKEQLTLLFKHIKYYNSNFKSPKVITLITDIDYDNRVVYADSLLLISLDAYLGEHHKFYSDFPQYIKQNNTKQHLIVDVAKKIIDKQLPPNRARTFLNKMIYEGKKMYLLDAYLPTVSDKEKMGCTLEKLNWAQNSEEEIWKYFIENQLLYSTNSKLNQRFIDVAPFSKFYLEQDNLSPGQIGVYIGWQIVRSYMQNNTVSLPQMLQTSEEEIFKKSRYKPRR
ncbi:gliding motility lipoprotein GldB [Tenacibaculum sp. UWU-22]|uniref:gliding motility lipoprotein GldB n=1 Tax=Tenacibaculum sp. UWU-22 TaxID=3234187 RepID=UPI0034DB5ED9